MGGTGTYQLQVKLPNTFDCIALIAAVRCPIRRITTKAENPITHSDAAATGTEPGTAPSIISATKSSISWYCALSNAFQVTLSQMSVALPKN